MSVARFSLPRAGLVRARLVDVSGRLVRRLFEATRPAGPLELAWDGRDDAGAEVPAGVYLYRVEWPGGHAEGRLVRVR